MPIQFKVCKAELRNSASYACRLPPSQRRHHLLGSASAQPALRWIFILPCGAMVNSCSLQPLIKPRQTKGVCHGFISTLPTQGVQYKGYPPRGLQLATASQQPNSQKTALNRG